MDQKNFNQDSMSLMVDDRFFESESIFPQILKGQEFPYEAQQTEEMKNTALSLQNHIKNLQHHQKYPEIVSYFHASQYDSSPGNDSMEQDKAKNIHKEERQTKKDKISRVLEKKKENSKNYRERKKQFLSQLQEENNFLKKKCSDLQQKVRVLEAQIGELKYDFDNHQKYGYQKQWKKDVDFLKSLITNQQISDNELGKIAMKMREKYGPAGRDRKLILNYYMSEYINSTMADFQKYLFHSVLKRTGPFGEIKNKLDQDVEEILQLTEEQRTLIKGTVLNQLYPAAISFSNRSKEIYKNYVGLLEQAKKFHDKMSNGLNYIIIPQLTRLVVWFDQNKNLLQVRKLKEEWVRLFSGQFHTQISPNH